MKSKEEKWKLGKRYLNAIILVLAVGCLLFLAHGVFVDDAGAMGAMAIPGIGKKMEVPQPVPTSQGTLTPTVISTPPTATYTPTSTNPPTVTNTPDPCAPIWSVENSANEGIYSNVLRALAAVSANDVWAVGYYMIDLILEQTLTMHWNGTEWTIIPSPNFGSGHNHLNGVAAVSTNDVWAVGYSGNMTLIEHWNGIEWSVVPSPNGGPGNNYLYGVAAVSTNDVWAVGYSGNMTLIEHWNGIEWSIISSPAVGYLYGVSMVSVNDIWAVGNSGSVTLVEHWDGTTWSVVPSPNVGTGLNYLSDVDAVSAIDVWAVGHSFNGMEQALIMHWDGTEWSVVPSPTISRSFLFGISAISANDIWAAGEYARCCYIEQTLIEHWNGTAWSVVPSPSLGTSHNYMRAVEALSASNVWVAGSYTSNTGGYHTLVERYSFPCGTPTPTATVTGTPPTFTATATVTHTRTSTVTRTPTPTNTNTPQPCDPRWVIVPSINDVSDSSLNGVAAVSANDVWAVGAGGGTLIEHWNGASWSRVSSPSPGVLYAVAAVSANDVWAVGYSGNRTLIEHWNGTAWSVVPSPNVGTSSNILRGVAVVSANDIWVVGYYLTNGAYRTLIEHWNGTSWSVVSSPNIGTSNNYFYGIEAISAEDIWAVGGYDNYTLVEHWDGTAWTVVPSPNMDPTGNVLYAVGGVSTNDLWAVGFYGPWPYYTLIEHWDGISWSVVPSPNVGTQANVLRGVAAVSANDVWTVGVSQNSGGSARTLIEYWDGTAWSVIASPNEGSTHNDLYGIAAVSASDVWAVGDYGNSFGHLTLTEHFVFPCGTPTPTATATGTPPTATVTTTPTPTRTRTYTLTPTSTPTTNCALTWLSVSSPSIGTSSNRLQAVAVVSSNDIWTVGSYQYFEGSYQTMIEHWDGTAWSVIPSANAGTSHNFLFGVAAVSTNDVWAVGNYFNTSGIRQTLITHWNGTAWSIVPSPNVGARNNNLNAVATVSANDVWAVGTYTTVSGLTSTLVEHWNGTAWSIVPSPNVGTSNNSLGGVAAVSANDVWAVGGYSGNTLIEHWDGISWTVIPSPNPSASSNVLLDLAVVSASDLWAVGEYTISGNLRLTLIEHWNGVEWSVVPSPNVSTTENHLYGVAAVSANDVWAVGYYYSSDPYRTLMEHWDGTSWSIVSGANPGSTGNFLYGVAAVSASDVWAVGYYQNAGDINRTLVEHFTSPCFTPAPTATNTPTRTNTPSPTKTSTPTLTPSPTWTIHATYTATWTPTPSHTPTVTLTRTDTPTNTPTPTATNTPTYTDTPTSTPTDTNTPSSTPSSTSSNTATNTSTSTYTPTSTPTNTPTNTPLVTDTPTPCPIDFRDVQPSDYFYKGVRYLYCRNAITGYVDGMFRPYDEATRAQVTKIIVLALNWQLICPESGHFSDVPQDSVFYCFVETAYTHGVINGYGDATFDPNANITRGQLCKVIVLAMGVPINTSGGPHFTDVPQGSVFYDVIETAYNRGIIAGYGRTFRPDESTTRGQLGTIVYRAVRRE